MISILGILGGSYFTLAEEANPTKVPSQHRGPDHGKMRGTVASIDALNNKIEVKTTNGHLKKLTLSPLTKSTKNNKSVSTSEIAKGDKIKSLRYNKITSEVQKIELE